jgi:adenylylsulfate kinase-like enzyme
VDGSAEVLDGDELRVTVSSELGFSPCTLVTA